MASSCISKFISFTHKFDFIIYEMNLIMYLGPNSTLIIVYTNVNSCYHSSIPLCKLDCSFSLHTFADIL